jgi:hypothetical protein
LSPDPGPEILEIEPGATSYGLPPFLAGDVILFASQDDLYGKVGRWFMRTRGEGPTYAVHTAQFLDSGNYIELDFVTKLRATREILRKRQAHDMWQRRGFEVWRCQPLSFEQRQAVSRKALTYLGTKFGMAKFLTHFLDCALNKLAGREIFFFRRFNHDQRYPICSWITAFSYDRALQYQFGVPPECADPDAIADWITSHPDEWSCLFRLTDYR